jgi:hypothetical protein
MRRFWLRVAETIAGLFLLGGVFWSCQAPNARLAYAQSRIEQVTGQQALLINVAYEYPRMRVLEFYCPAMDSAEGFILNEGYQPLEIFQSVDRPEACWIVFAPRYAPTPIPTAVNPRG